jgi:hypothetical protein
MITASNRDRAYVRSANSTSQRAREFWLKMRPLFEDMVQRKLSYATMAKELNDGGIQNFKGSDWTTDAIRRALKQLELII